MGEMPAAADDALSLSAAPTNMGWAAVDGLYEVN